MVGAVPVAAGLAAATCAAARVSWQDERRRGLARLAAAHVASDAEGEDAIMAWLVPGEPGAAGCATSLLFLILTVALGVKAFGPGGLWLGLVGIFLMMIGLGLGRSIGRPRGPVAGTLAGLSDRADAAAARFAASGNLAAAERATALAVHLRQLLAWQPGLTARQLAEHHTPIQVARYLAEVFFPARHEPPEDLEETGLASWLKSADLPLADDPAERSRVELLGRVRAELVAGGGVRFADLDRAREMIAELRAWRPPG